MRYIELMEAPGQHFQARYLADNYTGGDIKMYNHGLRTMEGLPQHVTGDLDIDQNPFVNMDFCPQIVDGQFQIGGTDGVSEFALFTSLQNLAGAPKFIGGGCVLRFCALASEISLRGIDTIFPEIHGNLTLVNMNGFNHVLNLFRVKGLTSVSFYIAKTSDSELNEIMNEFLPMGKKGMMQCQTALLKAGYADQAQL